MVSRGIIVSLLFVSCYCVGCSGSGGSVDKLDTVPASGKVTVDGSPFGPGTLDLIPLDQTQDRIHAASATVEDDGSFNVRTYEDGDGIVPGAYTVKLSVPLESASPAPNVAPYELTISDSGNTEISLDLKSRKGNDGTLLSPNLDGGGASTDL